MPIDTLNGGRKVCRFISENILNEVKLNGKIIDLGCGTGEKAIGLAKKD